MGVRVPNPTGTSAHLFVTAVLVPDRLEAGCRIVAGAFGLSLLSRLRGRRRHREPPGGRGGPPEGCREVCVALP